MSLFCNTMVTLCDGTTVPFNSQPNIRWCIVHGAFGFEKDKSLPECVLQGNRVLRDKIIDTFPQLLPKMCMNCFCEESELLTCPDCHFRSCVDCYDDNTYEPESYSNEFWSVCPVCCPNIPICHGNDINMIYIHSNFGVCRTHHKVSHTQNENGCECCDVTKDLDMRRSILSNFNPASEEQDEKYQELMKLDPSERKWMSGM